IRGLLQRKPGYALHRHSRRYHLGRWHVLQHHRCRARGFCHLLWIGTGRDNGCGVLGRLHLERVQERAAGDEQPDWCDVCLLFDWTGANYRGAHFVGTAKEMTKYRCKEATKQRRSGKSLGRGSRVMLRFGWKSIAVLTLVLTGTLVAAAPRKVIIDTDPGTDDAMAIMLALNSPEFDVRALTVVPGNVTAAQGLDNALRMVSLANRCDIAVAGGAQHPLFQKLIT